MKKNVLLIISTFLFLNYSSSFSQIIPDSVKQNVKERIDKTNQLIKEKGYNWKAGVTGISYLSKEEFKKFCGLKISESESKIILARQDSMYKEYKKGKKDKYNKVLTIPDYT